MKKFIILFSLILIVALAFFWFTREEKPKTISAELTNTEWVWLYTELQNGKTLTAPPGGRFILAFDVNGNMTSLTDCNFISGTYVKDGEVLSFTPFITTKMFCQNSLEPQYSEQLALTNSYLIEGGVLKLILNRDFGTMFFVKK